MSGRMEVENDNKLEGNAVETQDRFNHRIVPSLKHLSTVCIVSTIYKLQPTLEIIQQEGNEDEKLTQIVEYLSEKLLLVPLPRSEVEKSLSVCKFVASEGRRALGLTEILSGIEKKCECGFEFTIPVEYFNSICFKMNGSVDMLKTFFTLMNNTDYPNYKIFIAAGHLCSQELLSQISEKLSPDFHHLDPFIIYEQLQETYGFSVCDLNIYWIMKCQMNDLICNFGDDFKPYNTFFSERLLSICKGLLGFSCWYLNCYASVYFIRTLVDEQRSSLKIYIDRALRNFVYDNIETFNRSLPNVNIAFFLLSELNKRDLQIKLLRKHLPNLIIPLISNLYYQNLLEPVIKLVWNSLDQNDFISICSNILKLIQIECSRAKEVFLDLWNLCPISYRNPFVDYFCDRVGRWINLNRDLFKYFDIIKLILFDFPVDEKRKYFYLLFDDKLYFYSADDIKFVDVVDNLINEIFSSKLEITRFKKLVVDDYAFQSSLRALMCSDDYDSVIKALDWAFASQREIDDYIQDFDFMLDFVKYSVSETNEYEQSDKFLNWCCNSNTEMIKEFKKTIPFKSYESFDFDEWSFFLKFVDWCLDNEEDVKSYKKFLSRFENIETEMWHIDMNEFEYVNDLLSWCLSAKDIKKFKKKQFKFEYLSEILKGIAEKRILRSNENPSSREMGEKLSIWFGSVEAKRIRKLKKSKRRIMRRLEHGNVLEF